ncbi:MAG TPA: hypothetical protein VF192_12185 [Longimicrobiales bacterium]
MATATALDRRWADGIRERASFWQRQIGPTKKQARATGKSVRLKQAECSGEKPSSIARAAVDIVAYELAGLNAGLAIAFLMVERQAAMMREMDEAALRAYVRDRSIQETHAQGALDVLQMTYDPDHMSDAELLQHLAGIEERAMRKMALCGDLATGARLLRQEIERRMSRGEGRGS